MYKFVHWIFEKIHLVRLIDGNYYLGNDPGTKFEIYLWDIICAQATMTQFIKYKYESNIYMSEAIVKFIL